MMKYITLYSQENIVWADVPLGNSKDLTIGEYGCLLTDMAMICTAFGYDETPLTLNNKLKSINGFSNNKGDEALVIPAAMTTLYPMISLKDVRFYPNPKTPAPLGEFANFLAAGDAVIIQIDSSPKPGLQSHWLVLVDINEYYKCIDPWDGAVIDLMDRYGAVVTSAEILITAHTVFHMSQATSVIGRRRILLDDLRIRTEPTTEDDNNIVGWLDAEEEVEIDAVQGNWAHLADGRGWICERILFTEVIGEA